MNICAIIVSYFGSENTVTCVRSLISQGISKIVVMDNSGQKDQEKILVEAFDRLDIVCVLASGINRGFAGGINFVLKNEIENDFDAYLILNNDTVAPKRFVEKLITGMDHSCFDIAAPIIYAYPEKSRLWSKGHYYNNLTGLITAKPLPLIPRTYPYLTGCCLLVKRAVFEKMGCFDESFFLYGEDVEFCHRAARHGFRMGVVKDSRLYHRVSSSSQNNSLFYEYHIARGHLILTKRLTDCRLEHLISRAVKGVFLGIRAILRSIRHCNVNALRGYIKAINNGKTIDTFVRP